jgi:4-amino-4-deoxy-L-arabinose transferase-like glycosyltransferase
MGMPMDTPMEHARVAGKTVRALAWVVAAGAAVRLALWAGLGDQPLHIVDERAYNTLAVNLVEHGEFAFTPGTPATLRPPLYPVFVAGVYRVFGIENYQAVRLVQALLSLATVVIVYRLGLALYSPRVGLWAAGFCCFYPSLLGANGFLLTETLFTFLLCAECCVFVLALERRRPALLALAGVLLALGALTRSVLWLFGPAAAVFLLLAWRGSLGIRTLAAAVFLTAFVATLAPWAVRNTRVEQTLVIVDTMGGRNFMMGNYRHTPLYRSWDAISLQGDQSWVHELHASCPPAERRTQGQVDQQALRLGLQFVKDNPGLTFKRDVIKFIQFWGLERELLAAVGRGYYGETSLPVFVGLTLLIFGSYTLALLAGVFGAVVARPADWQSHLLLLLVIAQVCGVHTLVFGHSRYHLPLMPLVLVFTAGAWVHARDIWQRRGRGPFWLACAVGSVFIAGWFYEILVIDGDRYREMLPGL